MAATGHDLMAADRPMNRIAEATPVPGIGLCTADQM